MSKKFSLKLYTGYKLINYPEDTCYNEHTNDVEYTPASDEYCLTYKEFIFTEEIAKPIYEVDHGFENINVLYTENKFANDKTKRNEFILFKNREQFNIANTKLTYWMNKRSSYPESQTVLRRIQ